MKEVPSLATALRKLSHIFPEQAKDLSGRAAFFRGIQKDFQLSPLLGVTFLLPRSSQQLSETETQILSFIPARILKVRYTCLLWLENPATLSSVAATKSPPAALKKEVSLALLEQIYGLEKKPKDTDTKTIKQWISLADYFGLWKLRYQLEDCLFALTNPDEHELITSVIQKTEQEYKTLFKDIINITKYHLKKKGLDDFDVLYRKKNIFGIYQKIHLEEGKNVNTIKDIFGFRILVHTQAECYQALECLCKIWPYYPESMKDFIKNPKDNGYQSLHIVFQGLQKKWIEFQIRTYKMDYTAKFGAASHGSYKAEKYHETLTGYNTIKT